MQIELALYIAVAVICGCSDGSHQNQTEEYDAAVDPFAASAQCSSGIFRSPNESEGVFMDPGRACIDCHSSTNAALGDGEAPQFVFAGTVYPSAHEPNDCAGKAAFGAAVLVTDADGHTFNEIVNAAGNFSSEHWHYTYPLRVKLRFQGREREMETLATSGDCNSCHTEHGENGAPGRIVLP